MIAAVKTRPRTSASRRKLLALADAELALAAQPLPHNMPALIAELMVKPDLHVWDFTLLKAAATENAWAKAAMGRRDWLAGMDDYRAAVGEALDGVPVEQVLRKLARAVSA